MVPINSVELHTANKFAKIPVIPAQAGIQTQRVKGAFLDSCLRRMTVSEQALYSRLLLSLAF
jgi:hypothetical protein